MTQETSCYNHPQWREHSTIWSSEEFVIVLETKRGFHAPTSQRTSLSLVKIFKLIINGYSSQIPEKVWKLCYRNKYWSLKEKRKEKKTVDQSAESVFSFPTISLTIKYVFRLGSLNGRKHHIMNIIIRIYNMQMI